MHTFMNRRSWCTLAGALTAGLGRCAPAAMPSGAGHNSPEGTCSFCLNTSTIRSAQLQLPQLLDLVAHTGYDGIELWVRDVRQYEQQGGQLHDLKQRATDLGLEIVNLIGFARWIVEDSALHAQGLEEMKRDMDLAARLGCRRIAAPPAGATREALALPTAASRYRTLLAAGDNIGVIPQLELWGSSRTLSRLGELAYVATEAGHPRARVLPDVYHIYKGGSDFAGLQLLSGQAIEVFHLNDYPADPPREQASDADRVYPGDGVAPLRQVLRILLANGFRGHLSLELFNREYWQQDPEMVARRGLAKMKETLQKALS